MNSMASLNITWRVKVALVVALLLGVLKFGIIPLYEWQDDTIQKIKLLKKAVARKKNLIGSAAEIDKLLSNAERSYKAVVQLYERDSPDAQSLQLALQKEVEALSSANDVKIKNTDWLHLSEGEIIQAPIKINCEAPPDNLLRFIGAIEGGKRFRTVNKLIIMSSPRAPVINATIDISAYGIKKKQTEKTRSSTGESF